MKNASYYFVVCFTGLLAGTSLSCAQAQTASAADKSALREPSADSIKQEAFQLTLVSPLGMNGFHAGRTVNKVSLNLLAGYAAGVKGLELGGLLNVDRQSVQGVQAAGLANLVGGPMQGAQLAGVANITAGPAQGLQAAGLLNYQGASTEANPSSQLAGLVNVTPGQVRGGQVAGLLNVAKHVQGLQLAPFNIADSVSGASIGVLSLVRHGYHRGEVWASDGMHVNAAVKLGASSQFYNIVALGAQPLGATFRWGVGYGVGSEVALADRLTLSVDALAMQVNEKKSWNRELNLLNQLRPMLGWRLSPRGRTVLVAGPTVNVMVSTSRKADGSPDGSNFGGDHLELFNKMHGRTNTRAWVGFNAGLRF
jgi:hypothetical protein